MYVHSLGVSHLQHQMFDDHALKFSILQENPLLKQTLVTVQLMI